VKHILIFFLTGLILGSVGCRKKEAEVDPGSITVLMTLNFKDNFINPKLGAIVFASDSVGHVIADTMYKGNGKFFLDAKPGIKIPSRFMLTIVTWEPSMHDFEISLNSYLQVESSEWTLQGHRPDTLGHVTVSLSNVPQSTLILYANSGYANLTTISNDVIALTYLDPDDLFVKTENSQGQLFRWISDIHPGGIYDVDMASAQAPALTTIGLSGKYYEARIWGYKNTDYENSLPVMTEFSFGDIPAGNFIRVPDLPEHFQGYHTELKQVESWDSSTSYTFRVNGAIPSGFQKIDARVENLTVYPVGKIHLYPSGDFTSTNATWQFYGHNNQSFSWTMHGCDTTKYFKLPKLPESIIQFFPTLSLDSLYFYNVELSKYPDFASYDEIIHHIFNPTHPHSQNKLNASTLIYGQSK